MDINFFEEFNISKLSREKLIVIIIFSLLILSLSIVMIFNQYKIFKLNNEVSKRTELVENPNTVEKVTEINGLTLETENSQIELERLSLLDIKINDLNILTQEVLENINSSIHAGIVLSSINFNENLIELHGVGANPNRIAEYSKILSEPGNVLEVHISNISLNDGYYNFSISMTLEGDSIEIHN